MTAALRARGHDGGRMFSQLLKLRYPLLDGLGRAPNGSSRLGWLRMAPPIFWYFLRSSELSGHYSARCCLYTLNLAPFLYHPVLVA